MLRIIDSMSKLNFSGLMEIYLEGNQENGRQQYPYESESEQLRLAENDFYNYLDSIFFHQKNSVYAVWEDCGRYLAALRLEPYRDGYLLCALETAPDIRGKGYASLLIKDVQKYLSHNKHGIIYSHISKHNGPSLAVHNKCGFHIIKDYAVYSDGSVLQNCYTLAYEYKKCEI